MQYKVILLILCTLLTACQSNTKTGSSESLTEAQVRFDAQDYGQSAKLLKPLAEQGDPRAQYAYGYLLFNGLGVPRDEWEAHRWFVRAADQNYQPAVTALERLKDQATHKKSGTPAPGATTTELPAEDIL